MKQNILVGQSGGPTAVINASLWGVIREAMRCPGEIERIYGMKYGIEGFLEDQVLDLTELSGEELALLKQTPAAYLGSCRFQLPADLQAAVYPQIFEKLERLGIGSVFYIGGNDSMDTVSKLSQYAARTGSPIRFIGIPKTIDNDLVRTDHTPGYGSAARYVASMVREIALDAEVYRQQSVTIVEIMGRHAGWLTAAAALARTGRQSNPLLIYLPEVPFQTEQFFADLERAFAKRSNVVVCVSEGIADESGRFLCETQGEAQLDRFGHKMLTGCGRVLEQLVRSRLDVKVRSIELNVCQRCSGMTVSARDQAEAALAGEAAVRFALAGESGKMVAFSRDGADPERLDYSAPYAVTPVAEDVTEICNREKKFPLEWIEKGCDISPRFLDYALPLVQGAPSVILENGLPRYLRQEENG